MHDDQAPRLHTPLCDLLGIRYPIIQAPMAGGPTTPELVAAVSNAGGLGMLGASRMPLDRLRDAIRAIRALTDRPFGVNFLLAGPDSEASPEDVALVQQVLDRFRAELGLPPGGVELSLPPSQLDAAIDLTLEERVPVLSSGLGDPAPWAGEAHNSGARVVAMVASVDEAARVVAGGADVVVAQGAEAGGHRSSFVVGPGGEVPLVGTLALTPQVVDAVDVPVVAAGGIVDGRGVAAALARGASGAQLGTRFLLAREAGTAPAHQQRLLAAVETDTAVTRAFSGRPARSLRNRFSEEFAQSGTEPLPYLVQGLAAGDIFRAAQQAGLNELFPLWAGQGVRALSAIQPAAEIVAELVTEAIAAIQRLAGLTS
ncbi:MAG TPA: nitronate monooxygenase [Thermomicrobiaceae bacterium]|nr:nitronate monooxygenase [Thermomicrobiaceae bacterium]